MTPRQAQEILLLYRSGRDPMDADTLAALQMAESDPGLREWWQQQQTFHRLCRESVNQISVPDGLRTALLQESKTIRPAFWQKPAIWLSAAAAIVLLAGYVTWNTRHLPDRFVHYRQRVIGTALRQYRMDIVTEDMSQVRQFLASRGVPADYQVPTGLQKLKLTGGGLLRWRNNPVGMICFDRGDKQMLYLFVMNRTALKDPPPPIPQIGETQTVVAASWTEKDRVYVLAGPPEKGFREKYL
jgi:hypothetical protein